MCCDNHCLLCIKIRIACLVFGYISAILTGIGTMLSTGFAMYYGITLMFEPAPYPYNNNHDSNDWERRMYWCTSKIISEMIASGFMSVFIPSFVCSVVLLVGITQNKASYVKAYIIYGMVLVAMLLVLIIVLGSTIFASGFIMIPIAGVGLYCLILYMTYLQYKSMVTEVSYSNPNVNMI